MSFNQILFNLKNVSPRKSTNLLTSIRKFVWKKIQILKLFSTAL